MTTSRSSPRRRNRRGSALVLVLIMTLSLAGLAISAIYLSSSAGLLTRYYDKERDYRYAAEAALALGKSQVNKNAALGLPEDTAKQILNGATLTDANGAAISRIKVNLYGAYTGDTVGRFGQFVTLLSQAYDSGGTRHVRRLDLTAESFSRFAMFTNTWAGGLSYGDGEYVRGRAHSNQSWASSGSIGPSYGDTVSAVGSVTGPASYKFGYMQNQPAIPFPTVTKLNALKGYALAANLQFTPQTASGTAVTQGGMDLSGRQGASNPVRTTRIRFKPVDLNNDGVITEDEGMMEVFDIALGMDTSTMRVDLPLNNATLYNNVVAMNQCGALVTIGSRNEFFPVARFKEQWVRNRVMTGKKAATNVSFAAADTTGLADWSSTTKQTANVAKILGYGVGNSRCFPPGSPYLMLSERYVTAACVVTTDTSLTPYAWAGQGTTCAASKQYGGQDTTFTATVTRCAIDVTAGGTPTSTGLCAGKHVPLGSWKTFAGTQVPTVSATLFQQVEKPYLWPLYKPWNLNAKGVINATTGPVYMSDTLRGNVTFYQSDSTKDVVFIDDLVYDQSPNNTTALCRNFLGIISAGNILLANNGLNRPRYDGNNTVRWFGFPDFILHAVTMSLTGTVGIEDGYNYPTTSPGGPATNPVTVCGLAANVTSGGCINQTGGVIEQYISATYTGNNDGLRENRTVDPCQATNRRPPFFPQTGRYLDNKYYEIDPVNVDSWTQVKAFYARLRGRSAP